MTTMQELLGWSVGVGAWGLEHQTKAEANAAEQGE